MNNFDKNFHMNFSPFYVIVSVLFLMFIANKVSADESEHVEEIVIVAEQSQTIKINPATSSRIISSIVPAFTYQAGGYGGFVGYNVSGAQTIHTTVYVNGIPSNDPGNGWYDFAHDLSDGQTIKVISGSNGVVYGSGSVASTVLIEDTITPGMLLRQGDQQFISVAPNDKFQVSYFDGDQGSVRNDNDEIDSYKNFSTKSTLTVGEFTVDSKFTDYTYDYDNCYTSSFTQSNNCVQEGKRVNISVRNDNFTLGRSETTSKYFTEGIESTLNKGSRDYFRYINTEQLSLYSSITYGLDYSSEKYNIHNQEDFGAFVSTNVTINGIDYNFGIRQGNDNQNALRVGVQKGLFYINGGTSYRKPNLYEVNGDGWVNPNLNLASEEGEGYEIGYGTLGFFQYKFAETIDYDFINSVYYNAGAYTTQGAKYNQALGPFSLSLIYTDTEQPRVPKYQAALNFRKDITPNINFRAKYTINNDRAPSLYDGNTLEDLEKLNFYITGQWNKIQVSFKLENVLNEQVEILPGYDNEGREMYLTIQYNW